MKSSVRFVVLISALSLLVLGGCDDKKPAPEPAEEPRTSCRSDADCPAEWVCLRQVCSADNTARSNSVTAETVRKKVEEIGAEADKRGQKALDL